MSVNPFYVPTFTNPEVQTDGTQLDLSEGLERKIQFEQAYETYNPLAAGELLFKKALSVGETKISKDEANALYGVPGGLQFEEAIAPSVAEFRRQKHLEYNARQTIIDMESDDNGLLQHTGNFLAIGIAAEGLNPLNYLFPVAGKALGGALMGLKSAKYGGTVPKIINALNDPSALGTVYRTGFARGAIGTLAGGGVSEAVAYHLSQEYGYDYDVTLSLAFMGGAGLIGGLLGGSYYSNLSKLAFKSVDNTLINAANRVDTAGLSVAGFLDAAVSKNRLVDTYTDTVYETLLGRALNDLAEGRVTSPKVLNALLKTDRDNSVLNTFRDAVDQGKYKGIISDIEAENLLRTGIGDRLNSTNLSANLINKLNIKIADVPVNGDMLHLVKQLYQNADTALSEIPKLENQLQKVVSELDTAVKKAGTNLQVSDQELRGLKQKANGLVEKIEATKQFVVNEYATSVNSAFSKSRQSIRPEFMLFDDYAAEFNKIINSIGDVDFNDFLKLSDENKVSIARLIDLLNEHIIDIGDLNSLKNRSLEDLAVSHNSHIFKAELNAFDGVDPKQTILEAFRDPDLEATLREQLRQEEFTRYLDPKNAVINVDANEIETIMKTYDNLDPELARELEVFDTQAADALNKERGVQQLLTCMISGL